MKRACLVPMLIALLALSACSGGGGSTGRPAADGPILVQRVSSSGHLESSLRLTGLSGESGSISIPKPGVGLATGIPGKALYPSSDHNVYLVDAVAKTAKRLDIPTGTHVVPSQAAFGRSDRYVVLGSPHGKPAYLVDAQTGAVTALTALGVSSTAFSGEFSPDGSHYVFTGDHIVLLATDDPSAARSLAPAATAGFAGFNADGTRLAYINLSDRQHPKAVIENVDGSGKRTVDLPSGVFRGRLDGSGQRMLLERRGELLVVDLRTGKATPILRPRNPPALVWFAPSERAALVGTASASGKSTTWTWLDLESQTARDVPELAGQQPILSSIADRLLFFSDGRLPGKARSFSVLDLETGRARHFFSFPTARVVAGQSIAAGGRFALIPVQDQGGGGELWLLPAESGKPRRIATSSGGIGGVFSPTGDWVAVSEVAPGAGATATAGLVAVSTTGHKVRDLGEGVGPVWVRG